MRHYCLFAISLMLFNLTMACVSLFEKPEYSDKASLQEARALLRDGLQREAYESLRHALKLHPQNPEVLAELGKLSLVRNDFPAALRYLQSSEKYGAAGSLIFFPLAEAYRANRDFSEAIFYYRKALELDPENLEIKRALVWSHFKNHLYKDALSLGQKYLSQNKDDIHLHIIIAQIFIQIGKPEKAWSLLAPLDDRSLHPDFAADIKSLRADIYFIQNNFDQAQKLYQEAIDIKPFKPSALMGLGKLALRQKNYASAEQYFKRVVKLSTSYPEAFLEMARLTQAKDPRQAQNYMKQFKELVALNPQFLKQPPSETL